MRSTNPTPCLHCSADSPALTYRLMETAQHRMVLDAHPLTEGHILIIPRDHLASIGEEPLPVFEDFLTLHSIACDFLGSSYGVVGGFEHGAVGQTVPHAHFHLMPLGSLRRQIINPGWVTTVLESIRDLRRAVAPSPRYLVASDGGRYRLLNPSLEEPGLLRRVFGSAVGHPERANWQLAAQDTDLGRAFRQEAEHALRIWRRHELSD